MPALKCHQAPSSSLPGACWRRERFGVPATPTCLFSSGCVSFLRAPSLKQEACGPTPPAQGSQEVAHKACGTPLGSENPRRLPLPAESPRRGWGRGTGQHVEGAEPRAAHSVPGGLSVGGPSSEKRTDNAALPWRNGTPSASGSAPKPLLFNQRIQI